MEPITPPIRGRSSPPHATQFLAQTAADADQRLWADFAAAAASDAFYRSWLALQCRLVRGVSAGVLVLGAPGKGPYAPAAFWPEQRGLPKQLAEVAEKALADRRGLVVPHKTETAPDGAVRERFAVAYPLNAAGLLHGVVALDIAPRPERDLQAAMRQLQWGAAWVEALWLREEAARAGGSRERLQLALDLLAAVVSARRFHEAATAFVTALATELGCDRVSVGFFRRGRVRVRSMSHSSGVRSQTNLVRDIAAAMEEAVEQDAAVVYPLPAQGRPRVIGAHAELAREHGAGAICSVPLAADGRPVGGLTLERAAERPFQRSDVELCEAVAALAGPVLEVQRREDRWLTTKAAVACGELLGKVIGPSHLKLKLAAAGLAALIVYLAFATGEYRVSAPAALEPVVRRAVTAPFSGYIAQAEARAGDLVRRGQVLASLDERELSLQLAKWTSQHEQVARQHQQAMAQRNAAQVVILAAQRDQARAEMALIQDQLAKSRLEAPIDGLVVAGDLSQALRAPVERGQVLFEVAPLEAFRVILKVDERDIGDVGVGQPGLLLLSGAPDQSLAFRVEKITPVSAAEEGVNAFRVEARLEETPSRLRPGMEGVGKIAVDERRLVWIWTHDILDWVRLQLWTWLP
jgi:RND family efflux transporter MFP subunit